MPLRFADALLVFKVYATFLFRIVSFLSSTRCLSWSTLLMLASRVAIFDLMTPPLLSRLREIERIEYSFLAVTLLVVLGSIDEAPVAPLPLTCSHC